jgi:2-phosphosulfolactate phosphatase
VRVDVFYGTSGLTAADVQSRVVVVIDVLRASTSIAVALANGARAVIPFEDSEEAVVRSKTLERTEILLAGERKMLPIAGFDLGNSPSAFTRQAVDGKTILLTTTNGTGALISAQGAREVFVGAFVNFSALLDVLRAQARGGTGSDIAFICAGSDRLIALEDVVCAGYYVRQLARRRTQVALGDGATLAALAARRYSKGTDALASDAAHARRLTEAGFGADVAFCSALDSHPVVPVYRDRQITRLAGNGGR